MKPRKYAKIPMARLDRMNKNGEEVSDFPPQISPGLYRLGGC